MSKNRALTTSELSPLAGLEARAKFLTPSSVKHANAYADNQDRDEPRFRRGVGIPVEGALLRYSTTTEGVAFPKADREYRHAGKGRKPQRQKPNRHAVPQQRQSAADAMRRVARAS